MMAPERIPEVQSNESKPGKLLHCPTEGCGKVFRSSPGYRYHLKSHDIDPRPHVCQCCHKKFKSANGLKYHLRKAHHIEPVLSKQNLGSNLPKGRDSISSEEDPYISLNDSYPRNFMHGSNIPSPLAKSPLGLSSPLLKNLPNIPSPLTKSPLETYLSGGSTGSSLQSPYTSKDRYAHYYEKLNNDNMHRNSEYARRHTNDYAQPVNEYNSGFQSSRSSLSEYTQQCQQNNNEFRQQCQRLSTGDISNIRLPSTEYIPQSQRSSCEYYNCHKTENVMHSNAGSFGSDYHRNTLDYACVNGDKMLNSAREREFSYKNGPIEGKEYPSDLINRNSLSRTNYSSHNNITIKEEPVFETKTSDSLRFKIPCSVQNTEQIVPDINTPFSASPTGTSCDQNNNNNNNNDHNNNHTVVKNIRGGSESSNETELSDCVFQNENSNPPSSPAIPTEMISLSSTVIKKEKLELVHNENKLPPPSTPLLSRRTSRSKSIPPALVIHPSPSESKCPIPKDLSKLDPASRLRHLAEIATSPRSPFRHSPLPLTLTPSLLPSDSTPDWIKSPSSKFSFPDKPPSFLLTPTISRSHADSSHSSSLITSNSSLPPSPFLDNIQTPSFWPTQMWPTPVWLCFLKGCSVKFEQDDKEFMTTEDVAAFCTTPGGRRRDDMNFYTSGMKIVTIREKPSIHSARDMVELMFEQVIPGTQRLVTKAPIDHPFYVKHKGWSAFMPQEAMARYGIPFRSLQRNDTVVQPPSKNNQTPTSAKGAQVFTFSSQDTSRFSQNAKKAELMLPPQSIPDGKPAISTSSISSSHSSSTSSSCKEQETITLTYTSKSPLDPSESFPPKQPSSQQRLVNELKSISDAMKNKAAKLSTSEEKDKEILSTSKDLNLPETNGHVDTSKKNSTMVPRKKRRKPILGNEKDRRPMNGFMLFAKEMRVELTKLFPGKDNRAISKLLGERWRELSEEKREDYSRMAKEMADERMKVNPDCWKRKHRKDNNKEGSKSSSCDGDSPDCKKIKLISHEKEFLLPAAFVESRALIHDDE